MNALSDQSLPLDRQTGRSAFGGNAQGYHQSRSGYPQELFDHLASRTAPCPRALEIGAGSGLATEGLATLEPSRLALIEPDSRLCDFLRDRFAQPDLAIINGTFPEVAVEGPFDLVACAAAFHWIEPEPALASSEHERALDVPGRCLCTVRLQRSRASHGLAGGDGRRFRPSRVRTPFN